ncbi:hypothetical protein [Neisseria canis]|uniref:Uncharacterized protein n=1 Tax=Neisseria canis TaxID=493 RepID=A0A1X3CSH5_9NEIS|nr:hypothetical protein [Neisseria canis]OSI10147.1 hypothetical protein BWD07_10990 [Neisseria canis]VEF01103.1 Uncharacterised protein [Neisseria canis]
MKKVSALFLALMVSVGAQADGLGDAVNAVSKALDKNVSVNAGVGVVNDKAEIDAEAEAKSGGLANAGGVVASQKVGQGFVAVNAGVGVFNGGKVKAKATSTGKGSVANAGGVVASQH